MGARAFYFLCPLHSRAGLERHVFEMKSLCLKIINVSSTVIPGTLPDLIFGNINASLEFYDPKLNLHNLILLNQLILAFDEIILREYSIIPRVWKAGSEFVHDIDWIIHKGSVKIWNQYCQSINEGMEKTAARNNRYFISKKFCSLLCSYLSQIRYRRDGRLLEKHNSNNVFLMRIITIFFLFDKTERTSISKTSSWCFSNTFLN